MAKNNNTTLDTTIGQLSVSYESVHICTVKDLKEELDRGGCYYRPQHYCDFRYSTNLQRFVYDPYTGTKIDWKEVKNKILLKGLKKKFNDDKMKKILLSTNNKVLVENSVGRWGMKNNKLGECLMKVRDFIRNKNK